MIKNNGAMNLRDSWQYKFPQIRFALPRIFFGLFDVIYKIG